MNKRVLFLCNTVYQTMVALWLKHRLMPDRTVDLIVTDHMNGAAQLRDRIEQLGIYDRVFFAQTLPEARYAVQRSSWQEHRGRLDPMWLVRQYVPLNDRDYDELFIANFDGFSQLLLTGLSHRNPGLRLSVFEDGLSTYCLFEQFYRSFETFYVTPSDPIRKFLHERVYRLRPLYGNLSRLLVFNPDCMQWDPGCPVVEAPKIDTGDQAFRTLVNRAFGYENSRDRYDRKYLFFEESFFADHYEVNDVELVEQLAQRVGKENVMVKIHPRNPVNRFAEKGYKTNVDTSIPWEVILLNLEDVSDMVFVTVASSTILNPIMIFGKRIRAYSLYPCLTKIPPVLQGRSWEFLNRLFETYSDMITLCDSMEQIQ